MSNKTKWYNMFKFGKIYKEKQKYLEEFPHIENIISKELLQIISDENIRKKMYSIYYTKDDFEIFMKLYKINDNFALNLLNNHPTLIQEIVENISSDRELFDKMITKNCSYKTIYYFFENDYGKDKTEDLKKIIEKYGINVLDVCEKSLYLYEEIYNSENNTIQKEYIQRLRNVDFKDIILYSKELENILKQNYHNEHLLNVLFQNKDEFYKLLEIAEVFNENTKNVELLEFITSSKYNEDIINFIKSNKNIKTIDNIIDNGFDYNNYNGIGSNILYQELKNYLVNNKNIKFYLELYKEIIFKEYTAHKGLYDFKQYYKLNKGTSVEKTMNMLLEIENCSNIEQINKILNTYNIIPNPLEFCKVLRELQVQDLKKKTFSPKDYIERCKTNSDGVMIIDDDVVDLTKFKMLIHGLTDRLKHGSPNGELSLLMRDHPEMWIDKSIKGADLICCSLHSQNEISIWGNPLEDVQMGFSDLDNLQITHISKCDAVSSMRGSGLEIQNPKFFFHGDLASEVTDNVGINKLGPSHNEISFGRILNGEKIKPTYLLHMNNFGSNGVRPLNERTIKWAKYYNIPVVVIDGKKIINCAENEIKALYKQLDNGNLNEQLFYDILLQYRTIENVTLVDQNLDEFINIICDLVINNPTKENIDEYIKICEKYNFEALSCNDKYSAKNTGISAEIFELRKQKIKLKQEKIKEMIINFDLNYEHDEEKENYTILQ